MVVRVCMTGLQRAGAARAQALVTDLHAHGDSLQVAPCLDRCAECEKGFVAVVDGAAVSAPSLAQFLADLGSLR